MTVRHLTTRNGASGVYCAMQNGASVATGAIVLRLLRLLRRD